MCFSIVDVSLPEGIPVLANSGWSWHSWIHWSTKYTIFFWSVRLPWMISQLLSGLRELVICFWSPDIFNSFPLTHGWLNHVKNVLHQYLQWPGSWYLNCSYIFPYQTRFFGNIPWNTVTIPYQTIIKPYFFQVLYHIKPYIWYLHFRYLTSALISALISWRSVNSVWYPEKVNPMALPSPLPKPSPLNQI